MNWTMSEIFNAMSELQSYSMHFCFIYFDLILVYKRFKIIEMKQNF